MSSKTVQSRVSRFITFVLIFAIVIIGIGLHSVQAQEPAKQDAKRMRVTVDNFKRAETDTYFAKFTKEGSLGKFVHQRDLAPIDNQAVIRMNRDTLYSQAVFDLDARPVTITLPDSRGRFMAMQIIDEDHYTPEVVYAPGTHSLTRERIGTRYVLALIRTFADPSDSSDMKTVHSLQDSIKVEQKSVGQYEAPAWDGESLTKVRDALLALGTASGGLDSSRMFGRKDEVDPVQHLLGTASGWGGNPRADAMYSGVVPNRNDGKTPYVLTVKDVPVDGFWSVSVYNKDGFFEKNQQNSYTINNVTAKRSADGTVVIRFGGDASAQNYLPITPGWNYLFRMYRPRKQILDGTWKAPEAQPAN